MAQWPTSTTVPISDVVKDLELTINVSGVRRWHMRLWIGTQIIKLGGWVAGFAKTIVTGDDNGESNAHP
jgi:hypothetical protein